MSRSQQALTVVCEIQPESMERLRSTLQTIGDHVKSNATFSLGLVPLTHFMRWVIVDNDPELPAQLVFESNHDGTTASYLKALSGIPRVVDGLDAIFGCCRGWPAGGARDTAALCEFVQAGAVRSDAYHCGYRGVSAAQVKYDLAVRELISAFLDDERDALMSLPPRAIHARIREHLAHEAKLMITSEGDGRWGRRLRLAGVVLLAVPVAIALLPLVGPALLLLRCRNRTDEVARYDRPVHALPELVEREDRVAQNQLTHIVELKPGLFRYLLLRLVLKAIDILSRFYYLDGNLGGITTIHFGRWVVLRDPRPGAHPPRHRLLFFSNYDGSWDSYLGEFIDRAARGLTAVWSHTRDFPRTRGLWGDGARDEEAFKQWARDHQIASQAWYSNVPLATVRNIRDDIWIRRRVNRTLSEKECREWLARL